MARKPVQTDIEGDEASKRKNSYQPRDVETVVDEIEHEFREIDRLNQENASRVATVKQKIAGIYKRAKNLGIPKTPLKTQIELRKIERKKAEIIQELDDEDQATLAEFAELFGGTPLGDAALKEAQERREKAAKEAAANLAKMAAGGISPLRQ